VRLLAAAEAERDLHAPFFEVQVERHQRVALAIDGALEMADLLGVKEQLPRAALGVREGAGEEERRDVHLAQPHFAVLHRRVGLGEVHAAGTERLHLAALEHDAGLEALGDGVVERRGTVLRDELLRIGTASSRHLPFLA